MAQDFFELSGLGPIIVSAIDAELGGEAWKGGGTGEVDLSGYYNTESEIPWSQLTGVPNIVTSDPDPDPALGEGAILDLVTITRTAYDTRSAAGTLGDKDYLIVEDV